MALIDESFLDGNWETTNVRIVNESNEVLFSAEFLGTGEEIPDEYNLKVSGYSAGVGVVTVATASAANPYNGNIVSGVQFDDTTEYFNIIPGLKLIFSDASGNGSEDTVYLGVYHGTFDASGPGAGTPSEGIRHRVTNDGDTPVSDSVVRLLNQAVQVKKTGTVFAFVSPFAEGSTEKTAGGGSDRTMPYVITVDNEAGSDSSKTVDLLLDGVEFGTDSIQDISTGSLSDSTGLKAISPEYSYAVVDGPLTGLVFAIHEDTTDGDTANVLIFPPRFTQIAADVSGTEGTYGTGDVELTESGELAGVISDGGYAYYWARYLVPVSAVNESNPHPMNIAIEASVAQGAGWEE